MTKKSLVARWSAILILLFLLDIGCGRNPNAGSLSSSSMGDPSSGAPPWFKPGRALSASEQVDSPLNSLTFDQIPQVTDVGTAPLPFGKRMARKTPRKTPPPSSL